MHGRAAVADWVRTCVRAFPDYRFEEPEPPYIASNRPKAIVPWRIRGTNSGPIELPGFAATGRAFVLDGVDPWWSPTGSCTAFARTTTSMACCASSASSRSRARAASGRCDGAGAGARQAARTVVICVRQVSFGLAHAAALEHAADVRQGGVEPLGPEAGEA